MVPGIEDETKVTSKMGARQKLVVLPSEQAHKFEASREPQIQVQVLMRQ